MCSKTVPTLYMYMYIQQNYKDLYMHKYYNTNNNNYTWVKQTGSIGTSDNHLTDPVPFPFNNELD